MGLRIRLLGGLTVYRDGVVIEEWGSEQAKILLKILLSEPGRVFLHEQLIEHIWPDVNLEKALQFLRARVHSLRQVLEPHAGSTYQYVQTCPGGYRFNPQPNCAIDILELLDTAKRARSFLHEKRLEQAAEWFEKALGLFQGEYLPEDRYEAWAFTDSQRWNEIHVSILLELADCLAKLGHYRQALERCREAILASPVREDLYRQAMLYCYLMGNSNEALKIYQDCESFLEREFDRLPDSQTRRLREQISAGYVPGVDPEYRPPALVRHPIHHSFSRLPFTGRQHQWESLLECLQKTRERSGRLVLIGGEAGIGKTRLAQEVIQIARQEFGFSVLQGRCSESASLTPYQALMMAIRNQLAQLSRLQLEELPAFSLSVLRPWLHGVEGLIQTPEVIPTLGPELERLRFFEAVTQLLLRLSETQSPILLFLDDLQWADSSILDWMDYASARLSQSRVLLMATYRGEEVHESHPVRRLVRYADHPTRQKNTKSLLLNRLTRIEMDDLLQKTAPQTPHLDLLARFLHRESGGNPLFVVFLLQSMFEEKRIEMAPDGGWAHHISQIDNQREGRLPKEIQQVIRTRIARLDPPLLTLSQAISVIGSNADPKLLSTFCQQLDLGENEQDLRQKLESLEKMQVIFSDPGGYNFAHDKIREVVYQEIPQDRRAYLHGIWAASLEDSLEDGDQRPYELFAYHYGLAGLHEQALRDILPSLKRAVRGFRNSEGLSLAERALEHLARLTSEDKANSHLDEMKFEVLCERIKLHEILANREAQAKDIEDVLAVSASLQDPAKSAHAHLLRAKYCIDMTKYPEAQLESYKALEIAKTISDEPLEARSLHSIALIYWYTTDYDSALSYLNDEYKLQIRLGDDKSRAETLHYLAGISWRRGDFERAEKQLSEALALRERLNDLPGKALTLLARGAMHWTQENYSEAIKILSEVRELAAKIGDRRGEARSLGNLGLASHNIGQFEVAIEHMREAARIHQEIGDRRACASDLNNLGAVYWFLGEHKKAQECLSDSLTTFCEVRSQQGEALALGNLSIIYWRLGEMQQAIQIGREAIRLHRQNNDQRNMGVVLRNVGEMLHDSGDPQLALDHYREALVISRAMKQKGEEMLLHMDESHSHLILGNLTGAFQSSEMALEILGVLNHTLYGPWVWFRSYQVLSGMDRPEEAKASLRKAYHILMEQAAKICNERLRSSYLKNVPIHSEIAKSLEDSVRSIQRDDPECYELLRRIRWANGVICPYCQGQKVRIHGHVSSSREKRYLCTNCKKTFADRTGTIFANSNLPISKLFQGLLLIADLGSNEGARDTLIDRLEIHPRSARTLHKKLTSALESEALYQGLVEQLRKFPNFS
ncbi:tetratricopeptide repeat protein [Candidatus Acetothermia bacterium]|nr:tetratricopeptide repeat protein [Candidatus Acetothermia bacterium]MBI3644170.1 tetratricopeptide repeat protein [Candidatus Acetothermia bacterium]